MYKDVLSNIFYNREKYIKLNMIPGQIKWVPPCTGKLFSHSKEWVGSVYIEMERCLRYYSKEKKKIEEQFVWCKAV